MSSQSSDDEKLGHDPLEWLSGEEEEGQDLADTNASQASAQESENVIDNSDDVEPQSHEQAVDDKGDTTSSSTPEQGDASQEKIFVFPESVTVQHVELLHNEVLAYVGSLSAGDACQLDFESVNQVDSSGYQLLLSTKKTCDSKKLTFSVSNIQSRLKDQLTLFGDKQILSSEGA